MRRLCVVVPKKVEALAGRRVVAVSPLQSALGHSLALTADGGVWSWGFGGGGQLGHGDGQNQLLPEKIEALAGRRVVAVSAGDAHSLALTADGAVWSSGAGGYGRFWATATSSGSSAAKEGRGVGWAARAAGPIERFVRVAHSS